MSLTPSQHARCVEIMNELLSFHTSRMFSQPVDPVRDDCPNYLKVVKNPMDLGTVMRKLRSGAYASVAEWKADVNLVWANSFAFNPKTSLMRSITKELSDYFHKATLNFSGAEIADWNDELLSLLQEMNAIMRDMPKSDAAPPRRRARGGRRPQCSRAPPPARASYAPLPIDQLRKLTNDINSLKDEYQLNVIGELLRANEKVVDDDNDMIEVDIKMIRPYTQYLLQKQIDEFKLV